jgi:hypothetical protein
MSTVFFVPASSPSSLLLQLPSFQSRFSLRMMIHRAQLSFSFTRHGLVDYILDLSHVPPSISRCWSVHFPVLFALMPQDSYDLRCRLLMQSMRNTSFTSQRKTSIDHTTILPSFHNHMTSRRYTFSVHDRHKQGIGVLPNHRQYHYCALPSQFTSKSNNAVGSRSTLFYGNPYDTCLVHSSIGNVATSQYLFRCSTRDFYVRLYYRPALGFSVIVTFLTRFYLLWYTFRYRATRNTGYVW